MSAAISGAPLTPAPDIAALIRATGLNCGGRRMDCFACARNDEFIQHLRQSSPTGKSLLIFRNYVKPENQKYSASLLTQISCSILPVYRDKRGDRDRHDRAVGCDGREGCD
jgi:hypothetical protein